MEQEKIKSYLIKKAFWSTIGRGAHWLHKATPTTRALTMGGVGAGVGGAGGLIMSPEDRVGGALIGAGMGATVGGLGSLGAPRAMKFLGRGMDEASTTPQREVLRRALLGEALKKVPSTQRLLFPI